MTILQAGGARRSGANATGPRTEPFMKIQYLIPILFLAASVQQSLSEDLTTLDGMTFSNNSNVKVEARNVSFRYNGIFTNVPTRDVSVDFLRPYIIIPRTNSPRPDIYPEINMRVLLTTNHAQLFAIQLANDYIMGVQRTEWTNNNIIFSTNSIDSTVYTSINPPIMDYYTTYINTHYKDGHWVLTLNRSIEDRFYYGTVEIAPDGSTNSVRILWNHYPKPQTPTNWMSR